MTWFPREGSPREIRDLRNQKGGTPRHSRHIRDLGRRNDYLSQKNLDAKKNVTRGGKTVSMALLKGGDPEKKLKDKNVPTRREKDQSLRHLGHRIRKRIEENDF